MSKAIPLLKQKGTKMGMFEKIARRREDEYNELRCHDPVEYEKCCAFASHIAFLIARLIETGASDEVKIAALVEAQLVSLTLRAVKAENENVNLKAISKAKGIDQ